MDARWIVAGVVGVVVLVVLVFHITREVDEQDGRRHAAEWQRLWAEQQQQVIQARRAWEFWAWCNAVAISAADAAYDGPAFKLWRDAHGMYLVRAYKGHTSSLPVLFDDLSPPSRPAFHARWDYLGPKEGFPSERAAMDFLNHYLAASDVRRELDKDGHRLMIMASRPGEIFVG